MPDLNDRQIVSSKIRWFRYLGPSGGLWLLFYEIAQKVIGRVPKAVIRSSKVIRLLEDRGTSISTERNMIRIMYNVNGRDVNFLLDPRTSDLAVFHQIVMEREYDAVIDQFKETGDQPRFILDLGANIGLTACYLSAHYPEAKIVALEPSGDTMARLKAIALMNQVPVHAMNAGIWSKDGALSMSRAFRDGEDWSVTLVDLPGPGSVKVYSMISLLQELGWDRIDFLKIDVEGAEFEVFSRESDLSWLSKVGLMAIEIHDEVGAREEIESLLEENGFTLTYSGELTIARRAIGNA